MIEINLQNIEELIFYNIKVQQNFPELYNTFQTWKIGNAVSSVKFLKQKAISEFCEKITDERKTKLENLLGDKIKFNILDPNLVKNYCFNLSILEKELNNVKDKFEDFVVSRIADKISITLWK